MTEIRTDLPDEEHSQLKAEAAHKRLPLKELVAKILKEHIELKKDQPPEIS